MKSYLFPPLVLLLLAFSCHGPGMRTELPEVPPADTVEPVFFSKKLQDSLELFMKKAGSLPKQSEDFFFYSMQVSRSDKGDTLLTLGAAVHPFCNLSNVVLEGDSVRFAPAGFKPVGIRPTGTENEFFAASYAWPDGNCPDSIFNEKTFDKYMYHICVFPYFADMHMDWAIRTIYSEYKIIGRDSLKLLRSNLYDYIEFFSKRK